MKSLRIYFIFMYLFCIKSYLLSNDSHVEMGLQKYQEAIQTVEPEEKTRLLNEALSIYLPVAKENPSAMLLSNIGDVYYSFGQYGYAIGYYRRALLLEPLNKTAQHNLQSALKIAQVEREQIFHPFFERVEFLQWTPNERGLVAVGLFFVTFIFFSLNLWLPSYGFRLPWRVSFVCTILYIGSLLCWGFLQEETAVVVRAAPLRCLTGQGLTEISVEPGQMVYVEACNEVTGIANVRTVSGARGVLSERDLMFIE